MDLALLAAGSIGYEMFMYNRENYFFDREQNQERQYTGQEMRMALFGLYREDIRDLIDLTIGKMDNYLVSNSLMLGYCVFVFCEGTVGTETPPVLLWLYCIHIAGAFVFFMLGIWLAIHASIAAHSFGARLLVQFVRLPIPGALQLDAARAAAQDYEGSRVAELLRIPVWKEQVSRLQAIQGTDETDDFETQSNPADLNIEGEFLNKLASNKHIHYFRKVQCNWMSYDAYTRVCMLMGFNQLLYSMAYYNIATLTVSCNTIVPAVGVVVTLATAGWVIARLDICLSLPALVTGYVMLNLGPLLTLIATVLNDRDSGVLNPTKSGDVLFPFVFFFHALWIAFCVAVAWPVTVNDLCLPARFRAALYLDVFGWLNPRMAANQAISAAFARPRPSVSPTHHMGSDERRQPPPATPAVTQPASPAASQPAPQRPLQNQPATQQVLLFARCRKLRQELENDLGYWENPRANLDQEPATRDRIQKVREKVTQAQARLREIGNELETSDSGLGISMGASSEFWTEPQAVFIKLSYWDGYQLWSVHYPVHGNATEPVWEWEGPRRLQGAKILTVEDLEEQQFTLNAQLSALDQMLSGEIDAMEASRRTSFQTGISREQLREIAAEEAVAARPGSASTAAAVLRPASTDPREDEDPTNPAQIPTFGGNDALTDNQLENNPAFDHSSRYLTTFHPQAERRPVRMTTRKPGQIPWDTFLTATVTLIIAWLVGVVMCAIQLFDGGHDIPIKPGEKPEEFVPTELVYSGPWPHAYFNPVGLACHVSMATTLLVFERFQVWALLPGASSMQRVLQSCLAQQPDFLATGIAGGSAFCTSAKTCWALVLNTDGRQALRCPLHFSSETSSHAIGERIVAPPEHVWRSIAFKGNDENTFWAQLSNDANDLVPYRLIPRGPASAAAVPMHQKVGVNLPLRQLLPTVSRSDLLLGLDAEGQKLHRFQTDYKNSLPVTSSLPASNVVGQPNGWRGVCDAEEGPQGRDLFLLGASEIRRIKSDQA